MHARSILAICCAAPLSFPLQAAVAQTPTLRDIIVPHRAVYDISLARTEEGSGVSSADGRMVFEVTGSACAGYRMRQRMVVNIGDEDGNQGKLDFRITTFESGNGDLFSFDSQTTMNRDVIEAVAGEARRLPSGIEVRLKEPSEKIVRLDRNTLFPSQHLQTILDAARADRKFVAVQTYEGAGSGEESDEATAAIGSAESPGQEGSLRSGLRHWPVSVGYFNGKDAEDFGVEVPSYQMRFTLYDNGVTNDLIMDYGNYALAGAIESIEPLQSVGCASR
jgi:envelope integrity protein B